MLGALLRRASTCSGSTSRMGRTPRTPNALRAFERADLDRGRAGRHPAGLERSEDSHGAARRRSAASSCVGDELGASPPGMRPVGTGPDLYAYAELVRSAKPGDRLLLDDGRIELRVVASSAAGLDLVVVGGAARRAQRHQRPGVALPASALTDEGRRGPALRPDAGRRRRCPELRADGEDVARARAIMPTLGARRQSSPRSSVRRRSRTSTRSCGSCRA